MSVPRVLCVILEILARPSTVPSPKVAHLLLITSDCSCEYCPKSLLSTITLAWLFFTSIITIFSLAVPATKIGNLKSAAKTLFSALIAITGC